MPRIQGIYAICNTLTCEFYVGSSIDIYRRWADHKRELKYKRHKNALLQEYWERDGENSFRLAVIEQVSERDALSLREQYYIDLLRPNYNRDSAAVRAPYRTTRSDEADRKRFWSKVDRATDGCWLWRGTLLAQGYGCFKAAGKMHKAHRVAYTLTYGTIPDGLLVCHTCDNPPCVRPDHLFLGTTRDNARDMSAKGRGYFNRPESRLTKAPFERHGRHLHPEHVRGELNPRARLTLGQVEAIRARYGRREASQSKLAAEYGVAQTTISAIVRKVNWTEDDIENRPGLRRTDHESQ